MNDLSMPLDPEPWYGPWGRSARYAGGFEGEALSFEPREGYEQDRARYEGKS